MTDRENPFLIPPPPRPAADAPTPPASSAVPAAETDAHDESDDASMIELPPGLLDSATLRVAAQRPPKRTTAQRSPKRTTAQRSPKRTTAQRSPDRTTAPSATQAPVRRSNDEIVFFPGAPGAAATPEAVRAPDSVAMPAVDDATVVRVDRVSARVILTLPDGRTVAMPRRLLLGRNPAVVSGWTDAELLPLVDPAKSVSKTHAALELDGDDLWVHDLDSTNGVWVSGEGIEEFHVIPGSRASVPPDAGLELGELVIRIHRAGR